LHVHDIVGTEAVYNFAVDKYSWYQKNSLKILIFSILKIEFVHKVYACMCNSVVVKITLSPRHAETVLPPQGK